MSTVEYELSAGSTPWEEAASTDEELIGRARNGDGDGCTQIFRRYSDRVEAYLRKQGLNHEDAEDVMIDVFNELFQQINNGEIDTSTALRSHLFAMARSKGIDVFRAANAQKRRGNRMSTSIGELPIEGREEDPSASLVRQEERSALHAAMAQLDPDEQDLLRRHFEGISGREIAHARRTTPVAVSRDLQKITARLRTLMSSPTIKAA